MINPNLQECIDKIHLIIEDLGNQITSSQTPNLKALEFQIGELFTAVSQRGTVSSEEHHEYTSIRLNLLAEKLETMECLLRARCERSTVNIGTF